MPQNNTRKAYYPGMYEKKDELHAIQERNDTKS